MKRLFGTDGIRSKAGKFPLDRETVKLIGYLLARRFRLNLGRTPRFLTGRDTRESGEWIERCFHEGALAAGAKCESADVITTPGVAFLTGQFGFDAGIVISASHNPFQDNGIKIFSPSGKKLSEEIENEIESEIFGSQPIEIPESLRMVDNSSSQKYLKTYLCGLAEGFEELNLEYFKLVVDCANGASSHIALELFSRFVGKVIVINNSPDGKNINKDCGSLYVEELRKKVINEGASLGVAFDGDADRAIFIDEKGGLVNGDAVIYVMSDFLRSIGKLKNKTVVATVMSNVGLEIALQRKGIKLLRTPVGDKYVLEELLRKESDLGGEQSGHIIFPFRSLAGDGMLTALFLLLATQKAEKYVSELTKGLELFPQVLINVQVKQKKPFEESLKITQAIGKIERELKGKGRVLLRYSGTENLARVMIEGENEDKIRYQAETLAQIIREELG